MTIKSGGFNRYEPPSPTINGDDDHIDDTFLKEVSDLHDVLPQPFRRVDKLLNEVYDTAWEEIEKRECEKMHKESSKVNLPKVLYEEELLIKDHIECVAVSTPFLFIGTSNKIKVYKLPELQGNHKTSSSNLILN